MKTIGLLGGLSWVSTGTYYELLNLNTAEVRGPGYQPPLLIKSFDYQAMYDLQLQGRGGEACEMLCEGAAQLQSIGAQVLGICANTVHMYYEEIQKSVDIPVIHVADPTSAAVHRSGHRSALLLGTRYTMEQSFYRDRLAQGGIVATVPNEEDRDEVDRIIRTELTRCLFLEPSHYKFKEIIERYANAGAEAVIFGCTEIRLLLDCDDSILPAFDTTELHVQALLDFAFDSGD